MLMLLAIDTATALLSIALHDGQRLLAESTFTAGRQHSARLAPLVQQMLRDCTLSAADLRLLAVAVGPGSYTSLRIGVALAKGMAAVHSLPLVPVTALDVIAAGQCCPSEPAVLLAVLPAGRRRIIYGEYRAAAGCWQPQGSAKLTDWDDLLAAYERPVRLAGEIGAEGLERVQAALSSGADITVSSAAGRLRRAGYLAEEAWRCWRARGADGDFSAAQVMPIYLKAPG